ncbi:hypothetical protein Hanom_Chr17g01566421 [Helianthus anomalus]
MEDLEEGEIGRNIDNDERRREVARRPGQSENDQTGSEKPVEVEQSRDQHESLGDQTESTIKNGGKPDSLHGNTLGSAHVDTINDAQADKLGTPINNFSGGINVGCNGSDYSRPKVVLFDTGPAHNPYLGKRGREDRSPPSIGSTQGPTQKLFNQFDGSPVDGIDLNTPLQDKDGAADEIVRS